MPFWKGEILRSPKIIEREIQVGEIVEIIWPESMWVFPKIEVPQNGWFISENPIKMDDLGVPLFFGNTHVWCIIYLHLP